MGARPSKKVDELKRIKRLTVDIPEDLHSRFKIECVKRGTTMNQFIRLYLEKRFPSPKQAKRQAKK